MDHSKQAHSWSRHNWLVWACLSCIRNEMGLLWGLGLVLILENVRAKAQGPMGLGSYPHNRPPLDSCLATGNESRTIQQVLETPREAQPSAIKWTRRLLMPSQKERYVRLSRLTVIMTWRFVNRGHTCGSYEKEFKNNFLLPFSLNVFTL